MTSTYTLHKNYSFTDSLESYHNGASKERKILQWNGRIPTADITWHLLIELSAEDIIALRTKVFNYLRRKHKIEAVASVELTRGADGKPNNTVHFHVLTDDKRSKKELVRLFNLACMRAGLVLDEDFCISYTRLYNGYTYFNYFTKDGYEDEVILFKKGTGIQKFYEIGKWFKKGKAEIWEEIREYMRKKYGNDPDVNDTEINEDVAEGLMPPNWCGYLTNHLPCEFIRDRRYDWKHFAHRLGFPE